MIETIPYHELSDRPFEELFQFSNDAESSKRSDLSSEEQPQLSQIPPDTVDTRQADAVSPSSDQGHANNQLSSTQGTMESVRNIRPDYTSESLQSRSTSVDIEDGNPSNSLTDYSELAQPSAYNEESDHYQEHEQQFNTQTEDSSSLPDVHQFVQPQLSHCRGVLNPQDYYTQDEEDWRAAQPLIDYRGEFPDSQDSDQGSGLKKAEFADFESFINYSP